MKKQEVAYIQEMDSLITVIVTVHNSETYLKECLDSVVNQTYRNIEILCIDGGSTDSSSEILLNYSEKDNRIRIINDSNTSYGHKVNRGINEARGAYIAVLESDDMYETFMLEKLYEIVEKYHPDFVNADYTCFFDINGKRCRYVAKMYQKENYNCLCNNSKYPEKMGNIPRFWTGIFSKNFLEREHIRMNESSGASYQDMSFRFLTSALANTSYHLDVPVYLYRIDNPSSSMYDSKKTVVIADEHDYLHQELKKRRITNDYIWHNAYQWKYRDFRGNMHHLEGKYRQELFDRYREELEKDRNILKKYQKFGYEQNVLEMITEEPERIAELIEEEIHQERERRKCLYQALTRITQLNKEQEVIVFGCGNRGRYIIELLESIGVRINCITDNSEKKWNTMLGNYKILSPKNAIKCCSEVYYVVANKYYAEEIEKQLEDEGVSKKNIIIY